MAEKEYIEREAARAKLIINDELHAADLIKSIPTADVVERKTGKWILSDIQSQEDTENDNYRYICSVCDYEDIHAKKVTVPYCWHCGAQMIGGDDDV